MRIKDYEVIKEVGKGGMGVVYLARDPRLDRLVAIKKVKLASNTPESINTEVVQRFYREARALASLNHTNIVTVHDLGEDKESGDCYMVMEYLEGKNLEQFVKENGLVSSSFICELLLQACDALSYIHQKQMIHRDIKASNIIYEPNGILKLMDFGLVRKQDNSNLTRVGTILGSVSYMSLEQIKDPASADTQSDLYSLGVTAYYALSGKFPYDGKNVVEIIKNITLEQPLPLSRANPKVDKDLEKIIMKAISKNKEQRYSSAIEFKNAIQEYLNKDKNAISYDSPRNNIP
ncbi:MAG: serine/threonine protein kinase, partial [Candidatus Sericytochromatia bacterium]